MRNIKKYRLRTGYSQGQVAKAIHKTASAVSQYESGIHLPPVPVAKKMAELYGCDWTEFFEEDDGNGLDGKGCSKSV